MSEYYAPPLAAVRDTAISGAAITPEMIEALRGTKGWVMLIGILMFIGAAFFVLGGLGIAFGGWMTSRAQPVGVPAGMFLGMAVFYLIGALVYIFLGLHLVRYAAAIGRLIQTGAATEMEAALEQQRKFWKLAGVLALISIVFAVIGIVVAIAIPAYSVYSARMMH